MNKISYHWNNVDFAFRQIEKGNGVLLGKRKDYPPWTLPSFIKTIWKSNGPDLLPEIRFILRCNQAVPFMMYHTAHPHNTWSKKKQKSKYKYVMNKSSSWWRILWKLLGLDHSRIRMFAKFFSKNSPSDQHPQPQVLAWFIAGLFFINPSNFGWLKIPS